ncbi:ABC transporter ATP-binding protein [Enterococcus hulanensis]|uniref:ABC transporter ATP-binding protein n=1 Tax=Enterococcus hulanensis TaxID=2559929 RepID=UPI00289168B1|nr:ABC transporter ATP-binding protein [Enterococcus hulanensis]MDT2661130.1 ABC transporter ATP-binding protein [Enterococcus hulanensis]
MQLFSKYQLIVKGNGWKYLITAVIVSSQNSILTLGVAMFAGSLSDENNNFMHLSKRIIVFFLLINIVNFIGKNGLNYSIECIKKDMYVRINDRLLSLPLNEFGSLLKGNIQNLLSEDLSRIAVFLNGNLVQLISVLIGIFSSNIFIVKIHSKLFLVNFTLGILSFLYFRGKLNLISEQTDFEKKSSLKVNDHLFSLLSEKKILDIFRLRGMSININNELIDDCKSKKIVVETSKAIFTVFNTMLIIISFISMLFVGFYLSNQGEIEVSQAISSLVTSSGMIWMYRSLSENLMEIPSFIQSMNRFNSFINTLTLKDKKNNYDVMMKGTSNPSTKESEDEIIISEITITNDMGSTLLEDVSWRIPKNEIVGLSGENGTGKTTLLNSLMGFYIPSRGRIIVNGKKFEEETIENWRKQFVYISQKANIIRGSVYENILLGTDFSKRDAIIAGRKANVDEIAEKLPNGYESIVTNDKLSSGEIQRICLARAFLNKDAIILLDEPTSFLDDKNIDIFLRSIQKLLHKRTIIIVSHHSKVLNFCNEIFIMKEKKINMNYEEKRFGEMKNAN